MNQEYRRKFLKDSGVGLINGVAIIPIMISFCSIIFRHEAFSPIIPSLVKLVLFSSMIHQICFTTFSSLPFAIGQVQDAGLIFLSAMASDIVYKCSQAQVSFNVMVATTLFMLSISTTLLGILLMITGRLNFASLMQYLPMPVIGGYLAFIGFFCGKAGLSMMSGVEIESLSDWSLLFQDHHSVILLLPGLINGILLYFIVHKIRSPHTLPVCLLVILVVFYVIFFATGASWSTARDFGWIGVLAKQETIYSSWLWYDYRVVRWAMLPSQLPRLISMFLVVAFSSSLDVAAIEMELGLPLNYNKELQTVGISNFVSGLTGGFTGSYIFTQTIFSIRRGVSTRGSGIVVILFELVVLAIPISITSYLPKFLFGALLVFISLDLMWEWLVLSIHKMNRREYIVCLLTFTAIHWRGVEQGLLIGILLAMASFVQTYASVTSVSVSNMSTSTVLRRFEERAMLYRHRGKIIVVKLNGYIFFGSAVKILEELKRNVTISVTDRVTGAAPSIHRVFSRETLQDPPLHVTIPETTRPSSISSTPPRFSFSLLSTANAVNEDPSSSSSSINLGMQSNHMSSFYHTLPSSENDDNRDLHVEVQSAATQKNDNALSSIILDDFDGYQFFDDTNQCSSSSHPSSVSACEKPLSVYLPPLIGTSRSSSSTVAQNGHQLPACLLSSGTQNEEDKLTFKYQHHEGPPTPLLSEGDTSGVQSLTSLLDQQSIYNMSGEAISNHYHKWRASSCSNNTEIFSPPGVTNYGATSLTPITPSSEGITPSSSLMPQESKMHSDNSRGDIELGNIISSAKYHKLDGSNASTSQKINSHQDNNDNSLSAAIPSIPNINTIPPSMPRAMSGVGKALMSTSASHLPSTRESSVPSTEGLLFVQSKPQHHLSPTELQSSTPLLGLLWDDNNPQVSTNGNPDNIRSSSITNGNTVTADYHHAINKDATKVTHPVYPSLSMSTTTTRTTRSPNLHSSSEFRGELNSSRQPTAHRRDSGSQVATIPIETPKTEFVILDFHNVLGIDATAARSCFLMLMQLMHSAGVTVVFSNLAGIEERLLRAHGVLKETDVIKQTLDDALEWCEDKVLLSNSSSLHCHHSYSAPPPYRHSEPLPLTSQTTSTSSPHRHDNNKKKSDPILISNSRESTSSSAITVNRLTTLLHETNSSSTIINPLHNKISSPKSVLPQNQFRENDYLLITDRQSHSQSENGKKLLPGGLTPSPRNAATRITTANKNSISSSSSRSVNNFFDLHLPPPALSMDQQYDNVWGGNRATSTSTSTSAGGGGEGGSSHQAMSPDVSRIRQILLDYLEIHSDHTSLKDMLQIFTTKALQRYFHISYARKGATIYDRGDMADQVYFIDQGVVELLHIPVTTTATPVTVTSRRIPLTPDSNSNSNGSLRVNKISAGGIFGESSFFLKKPHSMRAIARSDCVFWTITCEDLIDMSSSNSSLCIILQHLLLKSMALSAAAALNSILPSSVNPQML